MGSYAPEADSGGTDGTRANGAVWTVCDDTATL